MKVRMQLKDLLYPLENDITTKLYEALKAQYADPAAVEVKRIITPTTKAEVDDEEKKEISMYVSTRDMDRDNEVIIPKGIDVSQYKLSPVILEGHDYSKPQIGKAIKITKDEYGLKMKIAFAPTEEGEKYWQLAKFMPLSASIGFIPTDVIKPADSGWGDYTTELSQKYPEFKKNLGNLNAIIRKAVLLETSIVPVPANPNAIQLEIAKALKAGTITEQGAQIVYKAFKMDTHETAEEGPLPEYKSWEDYYFSTMPCENDGIPIYGQKPYPNEHAARLLDPAKFDEFRRKNNAGGEGIHFIYGIKREPRKTELQAIRFDAGTHTEAQARQWLKDHDYSTVSFEAAEKKPPKAIALPQAKKVDLQVKVIKRPLSKEELTKQVNTVLMHEISLAQGRI